MTKLPVTNKQVLKKLNDELRTLEKELIAAKNAVDTHDYLGVKVRKNQAHFSRVVVPKGKDTGIGEFNLIIEITANKADIYLPATIASGKKPTGFVYQIEGTGGSTIGTARVNWKGEGITGITLGSIFYTKIPVGKTATYTIQVITRGMIGKTYNITINALHFKLDPQDTRYKEYTKKIMGDAVSFS